MYPEGSDTDPCEIYFVEYGEYEGRHFPRRLEGGGGLEELEETLKLITIYRWLALKFPAAFTDLAHVEDLRREADPANETPAARSSTAARRPTTSGRSLEIISTASPSFAGSSSSSAISMKRKDDPQRNASVSSIAMT